MKIYKYWTVEKQRILIDGNEQEITCYDRLNASMTATGTWPAVRFASGTSQTSSSIFVGFRLVLSPDNSS